MNNPFNKINLKQTKYVLPAVILLPTLWVGYHVCGFASFEKKGQDTIQTNDVNTDLPVANLDKKQIKSKYQSMIDGYGKVTDYSGVDGIEKEEDKKMEMDGELYSEKEKARIDSLNQINKAKEEEIKRALQKEKDRIAHSQRNINTGDRRIQDNDEVDPMMKQLQMIQRMANGERILTKEEKKELAEKEKMEALRKHLLDSIAKANAPKEVTKANRANEQYFNTVEEGNNRPNLIKGSIDEVVKAKAGSRLRIRLSDDIKIESYYIPKGSYVYANVTGFTTQRVMAKVTSIFVKDKILKVDLKIYDLDGMEGFYVPQSSFRDFTKEAGSGAMNMNMNMNSSGEQSLQSVAMNSLQNIIQSTTSALSKKIKENKAKIKYNTVVYLINDKDK